MKRALVVDDSKTAQLHLKRMLASFDLQIDFAFSAEEALDYLEHRPAPAIIFLDHHMEGMSGFEALKIIKANPATAMIPVVMYTAQKGDVYVGQARALGALDIISKGNMKPHNLDKVLKNLGISAAKKSPVPPQVEAALADADDSFSPNPVRRPAALTEEPAAAEHSEAGDSSQPRKHNSEESRLLLNAVQTIRSDLQKGLKAVREAEPRVNDLPLSEFNANMASDQRRNAHVTITLLLIIIACIAAQAFALFGSMGRISNLENKLADINAGLGQQASAQQTPAQLASGADNPTLSYALIDAISWAMDTDFEFDFGHEPFNETQMMNISNLIYRIASAGFEGTVQLNVYFGNACLTADDSGNLSLAPDNMPIKNCVMFADTSPDLSVKSLMSVAFVNFEKTAVPVRDGRIDIQVRSASLQNPRYEYPAAYAEMRAGEWNAVAMKNNRISVSFSY